MTETAIIVIGAGTPWPDVGTLCQDLANAWHKRASNPGPECQQEAAAACQAQGATQASANPQQGRGEVFGAHTDQAPRQASAYAVNEDLVKQLQYLASTWGFDDTEFVGHFRELGEGLKVAEHAYNRMFERVRQLEAIAGSQAGALARGCSDLSSAQAEVVAQAKELERLRDQLKLAQGQLATNRQARENLRQQCDSFRSQVAAARRALAEG